MSRGPLLRRSSSRPAISFLFWAASPGSVGRPSSLVARKFDMNFRMMVLAGFSGGIAMATSAVASPLRLTDSQLDGITAGAAATTVSGSSGTALGTAGVYEFATARQFG